MMNRLAHIIVTLIGQMRSRYWKSRVVFPITLCLTVPTVSFAAPPPPPPPGMPDVVSEAVQSFNQHDWRAFSSLFSPDVVFIQDGKVEGGLSSLQQTFEKWAGFGWHVRTIASARGGNQFIDFENVTNIPEQAEEGRIYDCCYWTRSVRYTIGSDNLVHEVFILNAYKASFVDIEEKRRLK